MKNILFLGVGIVSLIQIACTTPKSYSLNECGRRYKVSDLLRDYDNSISFLKLKNSISFLKLENSEFLLDSFIVYEVIGVDGNWVAEKYLFSPDSNLLTYQFYDCCENTGVAEFGIEIRSGVLCSDSIKFLGNAYGVKAGLNSGRPTWYLSFPSPVFLENEVIKKSIRSSKIVAIDTLKLTTSNSRPAYASKSVNDTLRFDFSSSFKLEGKVLHVDSASFTLPTHIRIY